jgi:hypothetical protein
MKRMVCFGIVAGALAYAAYSIRTVGIVLLPSLLLQDVIRKRKLTMFSIAGGLVFVVAALCQKLTLNVESDYLDAWTRVVSLSALVHGAKYYLVCLATLWDNGHSAILQTITYGLASAVALYGGWIRARKQWTIIETFAALYALLILFFPWGGKRYLIPIMPIYFFYFVIGIFELSKGAGRLRLPIQAVALASVLACFGARYGTLDWHQVPDGTQKPTVTGMVNYVKNEIGRNGMVVFTRARFLALYAETKTLDIYQNPDSDQVLDFYLNRGATHVITTRLTDPHGNEFLSQLIARYPKRFEKRFGNEDFSVYQLNTL